PPATSFGIADLAPLVEPLLRAEHVRMFDADPGSDPSARLVRWEQMFYWNADRSAALPSGDVGPVTLSHHSEIATFPATLAAAAFGDRVPPELLRDALYLERDGHWWQRSPTLHYLPASQFDLLEREVELVPGAVEAVSSYEYDTYFLQLRRITDAVGNRT